MDNKYMRQFEGCSVFRFNHFPCYNTPVDRVFDTWALNYAHAGEFRWSVDGSEPRVLNGPAAFWTWPGPHYRYWPASAGGWDHYFVSWIGPRAESWQASGLHPICPPARAVRTITDPAGFRNAFDNLHNVLADHDSDDPLVVHLLEGLLLLLHDQPAVPLAADSLQSLVQKVVRAVHDQPQRDWDFRSEADRIGCTPVHFRRIWKTQAGMSPVRYMNKSRMDRAAELLRQDTMRLDAIAESVGVQDCFYFSRLFRRQFGMPPGAYRNAYRLLQ